jgi:hypothetical protein
MASQEQKVVVSIEKSIHDGVRDFCQMVSDDHGLRIMSIRVSWHATQQLGGKNTAVVSGVEIETVS